MKFPYAISDFEKIITENCFYVDRTDLIPAIEEAGAQLLFLRPRRFGKSLLLSMLEHYYDLARAKQFQQTFGRLAIGKQPTPSHSQYFILKWDFSPIDTSGDHHAIRGSLYDHINGSIRRFAKRYAFGSYRGSALALRDLRPCAALPLRASARPGRCRDFTT